MTLPGAFVLDVAGPTAPPLVCPSGQVAAYENGARVCMRPLVETHPLLAVLLVAGLAVVFLTILVLSLIG